MIAYVGQTRAAALIAELAAAGIGECVVTGEMDPRRARFFHDNGAYRDFVAGKSFNSPRWMRDQWRMRMRKLMPDFVVCPDLVAGGIESLTVSRFWRPDCTEGAPVYLAVQDGMGEEDVASHLDALAEEGLPYAGLFVGGTMDWKIASTPGWTRFAHERGLRVHVGRVGVPARVRWARDLGVDSIDSCFPLMHRAHLDKFLGALQ